MEFSFNLYITWLKYSSSRQSTHGSETSNGRTSFEMSQHFIRTIFSWNIWQQFANVHYIIITSRIPIFDIYLSSNTALNVVALHRARLLFRWVTVCWQVNRLDTYPTSWQPPRSTQPSIPPEWVIRVPDCLAGVRLRAFTYAKWQLTLCDSLWQVTPHSSEKTCPGELYCSTQILTVEYCRVWHIRPQPAGLSGLPYWIVCRISYSLVFFLGSSGR